MLGASLDTTMAIERKPSSEASLSLDSAANIQIDRPM